MQEPELNLVAPLNACPLPPRMQGNHPCTRYSSPHTRRLNRHRGSPVRLLMLQQPWQLRNVGGDAPGLVAGEEVRRLPVGVADDEAPPIQLGVGLLDGPGGGSGGTSAPNPNQHASCAKQPRSSRQQGSHGVLSLAIGDIRRKLS